MKWKKFLFIGDSNTQYGFGKEGNWLSMVADLLQRKCDVINRGFSGYNTKHLRQILPQILGDFEPDFTCGVILMLGSNDSTSPANKIQHVPLENFSENIKWIIDYLINKWGIKHDKLILISPPKICDKKWRSVNNNSGVTHFDNLVSKYAEEAVKIAKETGLPYLDLYSLMNEKIDLYSDFLFDGLHLSKSGGEFLFNNLKPLIDTYIDKDLKFNYPYWRDLDKDV